MVECDPDYVSCETGMHSAEKKPPKKEAAQLNSAACRSWLKRQRKMFYFLQSPRLAGLTAVALRERLSQAASKPHGVKTSSFRSDLLTWKSY